MESWKKVWREGFCPGLPTAGLVALAEALRADSPELLQGATTSPPPLLCVQDWPTTAACAVTFTGWKDGRETVGECEEWFADACFKCDEVFQEPAACRWFLNWFDETPRQQMLPLLLVEVEAELSRRAVAGA